MKKVCHVLFVFAIVAYIGALITIGSVIAEILSDIGNALMLGTCALLLFSLHERRTTPGSHGMAVEQDSPHAAPTFPQVSAAAAPSTANTDLG